MFMARKCFSEPDYTARMMQLSMRCVLLAEHAALHAALVSGLLQPGVALTCETSLRLINSFSGGIRPSQTERPDSQLRRRNIPFGPRKLPGARRLNIS